MNIADNNKRIAKNTVVLYLRMLFVMFVSFFTTRIVLKVLGVEDFGLQNAIGGVVSMFSFVTVSLSTACARYYSCEIGRGDEWRLGQLFSMMILIYFVATLVMVLLLETVGVWYVTNKIVCAPGREYAAYWFFQLMVGTMAVGLMVVPYVAMITAYEHMTLLAGLSIVDVVLKLFATLCLMFVSNCDLLIGYGGLMAALSIAVAAIYFIVCKIRYKACLFRFYFDGKLFVELMRFNCWNMFGTFAWATSETFVNLLLNSFYGPVVNAARNVAFQLMTGVTSFTNNFMIATKPQIIKYWAVEDRENFTLLLKRASKLGYFLVFFFAVPLYAEVETFMGWWLSETPEHAVAFTKIILCTALINTFSFPIATGAQAVGRLALFEGIGSGSRLLVWPISWFSLKLGGSPESVFLVAMAITAVCVLLRTVILCKIAGMSFLDYSKGVFLRVFVFTAVAASPVLLVADLLPTGLLNFLVTVICSVLVSFMALFGLLLESEERKKLITMVRAKCGSLLGWRICYA